jgi:hypothetical protein
MIMARLFRFSALVLSLQVAVTCVSVHAPQAHRRNLVVFVADGLRHGSVTDSQAPWMWWTRSNGVSFENSHSLFPTFTTANASAIATGHYLGDTGDFSNTIYTGYPTFQTRNFGRSAGTSTPFLESDPVLGDLDSHFGGNYLNETTLLAAARALDMNTAVVGKLGPAAIQDVSELNPVNGRFAPPATIMIDDSTGSADGIPLTPEMTNALTDAGLPLSTPPRQQSPGTNTEPGTRAANLSQQAYFADVATKAILPMFKKSGKSFVLVYWSRDPDGTQHYQGDSLNQLDPGINGPTSKAAVLNADNNLGQILKYIQGDADLAANTDIFITSDHGFATISRQEVDAGHHPTRSYAAKFVYKDLTGRQEVNPGFLPAGFLAIDLAHALHLPLFDPDSEIDGPAGTRWYEPVNPALPRPTRTALQRPASGNGLIGGTGRVLDPTDAKVIVAANGGSDLIYVPAHDPVTVRRMIGFLAEQDYVGGLFVDDSYGAMAGALPLSAIAFVGSAKTPRPTMVVAFKTFPNNAKDPLMSAALIADASLQQGQGMHGSLGRDNTFNFMAAFGPDFKKNTVDPSPVGNADIVPTLVKLLGLSPASNGSLHGRVLEEALVGGPASVPAQSCVAGSALTPHRKATVLTYQKAGEQLYFDSASFQESSGPRATNLCQ